MNFESKPQSLLTFRVGPVLCCAPSLPVRSIITPPKLTQIAGSEPSTPGIFKHGSHIVKVLDLRLKFGVDEAQHTQPGNLIVTISEAGDFAFWVDQILDVFNFPKDGWGNLPPAIPRGIFTHTLLLNNKIHLYSEFEKLSTINNLGYLEHYIRHLTENESVKADANKSGETTATPVTEKTKIQEPTSTAANTSTNSSTKVSPSLLNSNVYAQATATTAADVTSKKNTPSTSTGTVSTVNKNAATTSSTTHIEKSINTTPLSQVPSQDKNDSPQEATRPVSSILGSSPARTTSQATRPTSSIPSTSSHTSPASSLSKGLNREVSISTHTPASSTSTSREHAKSQTRPFSSSMNKNDEKDSFTLQKSKTATSQSSSSTKYEDESSSAGIILFFILLLLLPAAGIYYYFSQETSKPYRYIAEPEIAKNEVVPSNENEIPPVQEEKTEPLAKLETENEPDTQVQDITTKENESLEETVSIPASETEPLATSEYYADIRQDEDEITITIHQPAAGEISKQNEIIITSEVNDTVEENSEGMEESKEVIKGASEDTIDKKIVPVIETAPVKSLASNEIAKPIAKKKVIKEIVHVVVKGDTLWAIAKKYVKNPFLYPELARLSNIKNPHRIYPGNRVRIRFTNN